MIINATLGNGFSGALQYIHKTGKKLKENERSEVIEKNNLIGSNPNLLAYQMREQASRSGYSKKPVLHLSFNFASEDNLTRQKEIECVKASMKHLGVSEENHQFVIVKHNDSKHSHYHAIINKVSNTNKILDTNWIKNKCVVTADKIEQDFKLNRTANRTIVFAENEQGYKYVSKEERLTNVKTKQTKVFLDKEPKLCEYKTNIRDAIKESLGDILVQTPEQLKNKLTTKGISTRFPIDEKTNKIKGTAFKFENKLSVKGSEVGFSANIILQKLEQNKELHQKMMEQNQTKKLAEIRNEENRLKAIEERRIAHSKAIKIALDNVLNEHNIEFRNGNFTPDTKTIYIKNGFSHKETNTYEFKNSNFTTTVSNQIYEEHKIKLQIERNQRIRQEAFKNQEIAKTKEELLKEYVNRKLTEQSAKKDSPPIETKPQQPQPIQPKKEPVKPQQNINKSRGFKM